MPNEVTEQFKAKWPKAYGPVPDDLLTQQIAEKFPAYKDHPEQPDYEQRQNRRTRHQLREPHRFAESPRLHPQEFGRLPSTEYPSTPQTLWTNNQVSLAPASFQPDPC